MDAQTKNEFEKLSKKVDFGFKKLDKKICVQIEDLALITKRGFDSVDKKFDSMDKKIDSIDKKIDTQVEGLALMTKKEFDNVHGRLNNIESQMFTKEDGNVLEEKIDKVLDKMENLEEKQIVADAELAQLKANYLIE